MSLKVHINPSPGQTKSDNGVGQVVHAQYKHLPAFGIEVVESPVGADVICAHIQQGTLPRVDVLHCHGLYWTADQNSGTYHRWHHEANSRIVDAARKAHKITVPSEWVAEPFRRDMRINPVVIGHGIDLGEWQRGEAQGYLLWNKNRTDDVCDPAPALELARVGVPVISTFAPRNTPEIPKNMATIGSISHDEMKQLVTHASVYLATTKETFGIGTLEALACGVPVLGYRHGGTSYLIEHQVNGYLAEPGDIDDLYAGWLWLMEHHKDVSDAAYDSARPYTWERVIAQYAKLYEQVAEEQRTESHGVSIIISCFNYGQYVGDAIESCLNQTRPVEEIIVVDDGSTDDSVELITLYAEEHPSITFIQQANQGVAHARNTGIQASTQPYIVCLDADDKLDPRYCQALQQALDADRGLGVAYTGLGLFWPDGRITSNNWPPPFDWEIQATPHNPPSNVVPCAAMFRRSMWERAGGYKQIYAPAEDTEFFTRGLSVGFTGEKITEELLFHYRLHEGSASRTKEYKPIDQWLPWMRTKRFPMGAPAKNPPLVYSYSNPGVSVVIPVGPGHMHHLPNALDSLLGQTNRNWEVIVVNDDDPKASFAEMMRITQTYPFIRLFTTKGRTGAGHARNLGIDLARAPLLLFLDADDNLMPDAIEKMLKLYISSGGRYVYTDWVSLTNGDLKQHETPEYSQEGWLQRGQHAVTALIPTVDVRGVGGFDTKLVGWEDWDFFVKLAVSGVCGIRLSEPLLVYRYDTGTRRNDSFEKKDELLAALKKRYAAFATGEKAMAKCCGGNGNAIINAKRAIAGEPPLVENPPDMAALGGVVNPPPAVVRMEFIGEQRGASTYIGKPSGTQYRGGNNPYDKYIDADPRDVEHLESLGLWRRVAQRVSVPV